LIGHPLPTAGVDTGNGAAGNDRRRVSSHQSMLSGRSIVCPITLDRYAVWTTSTARLPSSPVWTRVGEPGGLLTCGAVAWSAPDQIQ
jgi:hypothetical protein